MTNEIQQLWNTLDQLRHQRHWESEGKHLLSKALADARRAALEEAAKLICPYCNDPEWAPSDERGHKSPLTNTFFECQAWPIRQRASEGA